MRKKIIRLLVIIAAVLAIIGFILTHILEMSLIEVLNISISAPLWTIAVIIISIALFLLILLRKKPELKPHTSDEFMLHGSPRKITSARKESLTPIPSRLIRSPKGSFATWIYLHQFGEGIRKLVNNRYIIAHDTNKGVAKQIGEHKLYVNVFALSRGPKKFNPPEHPVWKLWLANAQGEKRIWEWEDSEELEPGWHHFLIRWDHARPLLEFLIDGQGVIKDDNYIKNWPGEYDGKIMVGTWSGRGTVHYIETQLWRTMLYYGFLDDDWLKRELALPAPPSP